MTMQLLPCETVFVVGQADAKAKPGVLAVAGDVPGADIGALVAGFKGSTDQLAAENGVKAGLFAHAIDGFQAWVTRPLQHDGGGTAFLLCLNRPRQLFESSALTRLATLQASTDPMPKGGRKAHTGPPSGIAALTRYLDTRITATGISDTAPLALLRLDLGRIGPINDSDGWPVSDALIEGAYALLREIAPNPCFTVHLGGGSFAVVVPLERDVEKAEALGSAIIARMNEGKDNPDNGFPFEPYIGWAAYPFDAPDTDTLTGFANAALARIRGVRAGPCINRVAPEIAHAHADQMGMEADLRKAVAGGDFTINWLPVLETSTERVIAFEALVRWNRPGHGEIDPSFFLTCAENAGLIEDIDRWVLHDACRQAKAWKKPLGLSINVSPCWLDTERVASSIGEALQKSGLDPERLRIELSERRSFGSADSARKELARIRGMGVRLTLDDFGTGFGALERLTNYPFDQVKLDRMFVNRLGTDSRVETVLRSTLYMIHSLNMTCCAEGVETEEQLGFLDAHGCEEIQGFLIGRPTIQLPDYQDD
ncbi:EAL domain-containing protein [Acetobacter sp. LMG 1636]|uniref:EAL domain-containing protein n=2 Tax=Acetobacter fallax TaxID=1737473 RepID=A0ABX0K5M3_9PROT|nr:EAL domain-containing protein [Acetobacter fallax]NHO34747.1 EAL domain-containing protein [Acetobacter fallax]